MFGGEMTHAPQVDKAASDAWDRECAKPGAHFWERVVGPIYAAHYKEQIAHFKNALITEMRNAVNIYEPAAMVAKKYADLGHTELGTDIANEIRDLPNAPNEVPVFTAEWVGDHLWGANAYEKLVNAINSRLAAFRPAPASEPDLEKMQEALVRAFEKSPYRIAVEFMQRGGKYLAAEGFRLGEPAVAASPKNCTCHPDEAVTPCPRLHAHSECAAHETQDQREVRQAKENDLRNEGYEAGFLVGIEINEEGIQSRIHAAVLEEREAQGDAAIRLAHVKQFCGVWLSSDRLEDGTISDAEQKTLQGVWRVAGFDRTFSGATNSEIATDGATGRDDPPSGTAPSPGTAGDKDPAPSDREKIFAIIEREFPTTGCLVNKIIQIYLAHPDLGDVP